MKTPRPGFRLRAAWAALLSLAAPGLGHVYARAWRIGVVLAALNELLSLAARLIASRTSPTVPGIGVVAFVILLSLILMLVAATDAARRLLKAGPGPVRATTGTRPKWFRSTWLAAAVLLALGFGINGAVPFRWRGISVPSGSMVPTLMVGDNIVADLRPGLRIRRGNVILFTHAVAPPADTGGATPPPVAALFIKRAIGLPGDRVAIRDGRVVLNGQPVPRRDDGAFIIPEYMSFGIDAHRWTETLPDGISYTVVTTPGPADATKTASRTMPEITVPPGQVFVLGDNRDNSMDSRFPAFGTIPTSQVLGKAQTIYWSRDRTRIMTPVM
jgi:signal peptidase I